MDFEPEFGEDENDLDVTGDVQDAPDTLGESDADVDAQSDYETGAEDDMEVAADEVFSPVDESTAASEADDAVPGADGNAATFERSPEAASGNPEAANQGPYVDFATVSESALTVPHYESGPIKDESSSPGATPLETPPSGAASAHAPNSDLSPHAQQMLQPTPDGGPPMARPIIIVRLADDQMEQVINETLRRSARRSEQTSKEVAQYIVDQEFWRRDCQERAILGH